MMKRLMAVAAAATLMAGVGGFANNAQAVLFNFVPITDNSGDQVEVAEQLWVDVTSTGGGSTVSFKFTNDDVFDLDESGNIDSVITQIYFDDDVGALDFTMVTITDSGAGVAFDSPATPGNLPSGNTISFSADYSADADNPQSTNGIDDGVGEFVIFEIDLLGGSNFGDILAAMGTDFRIGLHVQSIGQSGNSDSFVVTPVPAAAWLFLTGIAGLAGFRRFKSRAAA